MNRQFHLTILGSNSAIPAYGRFPTSQILKVNGKSFLIDCGEGSQIRMSQYKIKKNSINYIFISHLHGDHVYGLPGLLTSMSLNSRKTPLEIFGPPGLKRLLSTVFELSKAYFSYQLNIHEYSSDRKLVILELDDIKVSLFPVFHRIETYGFLFEEKLSQKNIRKEVIEQYSMSIEEIKSVKNGADLLRGETVIANSELTLTAPKSVSYAYCSDSAPDERILSSIQDVNVLYFETTYLEDMLDQAKRRGHSTSRGAALMALNANAKLLVTGHYSSRYRDPEDFRFEVEEIFKPVVIGRDGEMVNILDFE